MSPSDTPISSQAINAMCGEFGKTMLLLLEARTQIETLQQENALLQARLDQSPAVRALRPQKPADEAKEATGG